MRWDNSNFSRKSTFPPISTPPRERGWSKLSVSVVGIIQPRSTFRTEPSKVQTDKQPENSRKIGSQQKSSGNRGYSSQMVQKHFTTSFGLEINFSEHKSATFELSVTPAHLSLGKQLRDPLSAWLGDLNVRQHVATMGGIISYRYACTW